MNNSIGWAHWEPGDDITFLSHMPTVPEWAGSPDITPWNEPPWQPDPHWDSFPATDFFTPAPDATYTYTFPDKQRTVYTGGSFDLFHRGHVNLLRRCRKIAGDDGRVVVSLNSDELIIDRKGRCTVPYEDRKIVLEACEYVDEVIENVGGADSKPAIISVGPDFIVIGMEKKYADQDSYYKVMDFTQEWLDQKEITLIYLPYTEGISSGQIRRKLDEA